MQTINKGKTKFTLFLLKIYTNLRSVSTAIKETGISFFYYTDLTVNVLETDAPRQLTLW